MQDIPMLRYIEFSAIPIHDPLWDESHVRKGKAFYLESFDLNPVLEEILRERGYKLQTEPISTPANPEEVLHVQPRVFEKLQSGSFAVELYLTTEEELLH